MVHQGIWTDYSKGAVHGWSLTLTSTQGLIFLAVLALATGMTGQRSWKIFKFVIHQSRKYHEPRDAMIKEQEFALCTSETDLGTAQQMVTLLKNWQNLQLHFPLRTRDEELKRSRRSTRIVFVIALVHGLTFIVLAVLIPTLLGNVDSPPVLVDSDVCAVWQTNGWEPNQTTQGAIAQLSSRTAANALNYYENCYRPGAPVDCRLLVKQSLKWTESTTECPFKSGTCLAGTKPVIFDTGNISLSDLGVNSKISGTLLARKRMICSPIDIRPYQINLTLSSKNTTVFNFTNNSYTSKSKYWPDLFPILETGVRHEDYIVRTLYKPGGPTGSPPLNSRLNRTNGDVSIVLIQKDGIMFTEAISDPIFETELHPKTVDLGEKGSLPFYYAKESFSAIGCVEQTEIYNNRNNLRSLWQSLNLNTKIFYDGLLLDKDQGPLISFLSSALKGSTLAHIPNSGRTTYIEARSSSPNRRIQLALPHDQWIRECRRWWGISLSLLQLQSLSFAVGSFFQQDTSSFKNLLDQPHLTTTKDFFCHNLKFRSPQHVTVNLFGLSCVLLAFICIWTVSLSDGFVGRRMFHTWPHRVLAWRLDSSKQLIRQLHETMSTASGQTPLPNNLSAAHGTLGIPVVVRENGHRLKAIYSIGQPPPSSAVDFHEAKDDLIGMGWETTMMNMLKDLGSNITSQSNRGMNYIAATWRRARSPAHRQGYYLLTHQNLPIPIQPAIASSEPPYSDDLEDGELDINFGGEISG